MFIKGWVVWIVVKWCPFLMSAEGPCKTATMWDIQFNSPDSTRVCKHARLLVMNLVVMRPLAPCRRTQQLTTHWHMVHQECLVFRHQNYSITHSGSYLIPFPVTWESFGKAKRWRRMFSILCFHICPFVSSVFLNVTWPHPTTPDPYLPSMRSWTAMNFRAGLSGRPLVVCWCGSWRWAIDPEKLP